MATTAALLVAVCLAAAAISAHGGPLDIRFPPTLGINKFEQPFKINNAFDNPHSAWNWYVYVFCGNEAWILSEIEQAFDNQNIPLNRLKTWDEFLATSDATEEHHSLELPTCQNAEKLGEMGVEISAKAYMIYSVEPMVLKLVKELEKSDIRLTMTPAREINIRKDIRAILYDKPLKFMGNVLGNHHGITKEGPSLAPRLLRFIFHDALDFGNMVMFNGTEKKFPADYSDDFLIDNLLVSANRGTGEPLKNMLVPPKKRLKVGGVDGCTLEPMESMLPQAFRDEVRAESPLPFFNGNSPGASTNQNIGFQIIKNNAYKGTVSTSKAAHRLISDIDLLILTAAFGLEQFYMTPTLPIAYGRRDRWGIKDCALPDGFDISLQTSVVNSWDKQSSLYNFKVFQHLGFGNKKLLAALMGAHSIGQIQPCNTGDSGFGDALCQAEAQYLSDQGYNMDLVKANYYEDNNAPSPGSFFDTSPESLDNDYFKMLKIANNKRQKNNPEANEAGFMDCGGVQSLRCDLDVCDRSWEDGKFVVMVNTTGFANDYTKRVALSASEVIMMDNKKYKKNVNKLSKNNNNFRDTFVDAWTTLLNIGHWPEELYSMNPDPCVVTVTEADNSVSAFCGSPTNTDTVEEISTLTVDLTGCSIHTDGMDNYHSATFDELATAAPCELLGAYGSNLAKMQCGGLPNQILYCPV